MEKILVVGCEGIGGAHNNNEGNVINIGSTACTGIKTRHEMGVLKENETIRIEGFCSEYFSCQQSVLANRMKGKIRTRCPLLIKH